MSDLRDRGMDGMRPGVQVTAIAAAELADDDRSTELLLGHVVGRRDLGIKFVEGKLVASM